MSSGIVDQITLECLMNKDTYNRIMANKNVIHDKNKDKKFYRKRIGNLTKELLLNNPPDELLPDVTFAFEHYVKTCVHYFKIIDASDIIQNDYNNNNNDNDSNKEAKNETEEEIEEISSSSLVSLPSSSLVSSSSSSSLPSLPSSSSLVSLPEEISNEYVVHQTVAKMVRPTLDNFIKNCGKKTEEEATSSSSLSSSSLSRRVKPNDILPKQKDIDLTNPELKNKGICKKKNIDK